MRDVAGPTDGRSSSADDGAVPVVTHIPSQRLAGRAEKLQPVAEGIVCIEAAPPGEQIVPLDFVPQVRQAGGQCVEVDTDEGRMGLLGRPKTRFDTYVDLGGSVAGPRPAAGDQRIRFGYFGEPNRLPEGAGRWFAPGWRRQLHVVQVHVSTLEQLYIGWPMSHPVVMYKIDQSPQLSEPALLMSFTGWVDAGGVGTQAAGLVASGGEVIGRFDADALFDYRVNRPTADFIDGKLTRVEYPEITITARSIDGVDLLVVSGTEPEFRWGAFCESVYDLSQEFNVSQLICMGSVPGPVPHTLPTPVLNTSVQRDFAAEGERVAEGLLQVPAAAVTAVEWHLGSLGMPTAGFWAQVPHYMNQPFVQAVMTLVDRVGRHLDVMFPLNDLPEQADQQRVKLDEMAAQQPDIASHIERLETLSDEDEAVPSAEEIGFEIERFLRDESEGGTN